MGVASIILGIFAIIIAFVPFLGVTAWTLIIIGMVLGFAQIVKASRKNEPKGSGIFGVILCGIAIVICIVMSQITIQAINTTMPHNLFNTSLMNVKLQ